jgi:hypothetical protein
LEFKDREPDESALDEYLHKHVWTMQMERYLVYFYSGTAVSADIVIYD